MAVDTSTGGWMTTSGSVERTDFGLWIDGELLSEKDELEGTTHGTSA